MFMKTRTDDGGNEQLAKENMEAMQEQEVEQQMQS